MTFQELLDEMRNSASTVDAAGRDFLAVQVNVTGENGGVFYVEVKDGHINIEPYEYYDRNCMITLGMDELTGLMKGELDPGKAYDEGILKAEGDLGKALEFADLINEAK